MLSTGLYLVRRMLYMKREYIFQIARVRSLENRLFDNQMIAQLVSSGDYDTCISAVREHGWGGDNSQSMTEEEILKYEIGRTWKDAQELAGESEVIDVLKTPQSFHNLKAAVKCAACGYPGGTVFYGNEDSSSLTGDELVRIIQNGEYGRLPEYMRDCADEAFKSLAHTGNGQMSDAVIDRTCLETMLSKAKSSGSGLAIKYSELYVAYCDIRIAYRAAATARPKDFIMRSVAACEGLDKDKLVSAALGGTDKVLEYISAVGYLKAAEALKAGSAAFEKLFDDEITELIRPSKYDSFTVGAIAAYVLARLCEIKNVRIILSGKRNLVSDDVLVERVRMTYV